MYDTEQMDYNQPVQQRPKKKTKTIIALIMVWLILLIGAAGGGYFYGTTQREDVKVTRGSDSVDEDELGSSASNQQVDVEGARAVLSRGYLDEERVLAIKLVAPGRLQTIAVRSSDRDPGLTGSLMGLNGRIEEMGRWRFGNPQLASYLGGVGEVSIMQISDSWLKEITTNPNYAISSVAENIVHGYDFTTPDDKLASLEQLKLDTSKCADEDAGFSISNIVDVCYELIDASKANGAYKPTVELKGYGTVDSRQYVMFGSVELVDRIYSTDEAVEKSEAFSSGKIPKETEDLLAEFLEALKSSEIVVTPR